MSEPSPQSAVFLSYARDDAAAARRIAEALRASGLEVWFDENELRGGDAWDQKIRQQINDCALFVAVISRHTEARTKGYFRLEWKLAVEQTHMLLDGVPFVAPVAIDDTRETGARVPPEFLRVQWTRLPGALPTPQFVEQIKRLLAAGPAAGVTAPPMALRPVPAPAAAATPSPAAKANFPTALVAALAVVVLALAGYIALRPAAKETPPPVAAKPAVEAKSAAPASSSVLPVPSRAPEASAKSIAVLPFANLSTEKENEFFADGVQDDVITNLAKIRDLTVISRTSTLAYRDAASRNLKKIGAELNVANVLEASVRRVGSKVHMNAQLIDARTDAHLWADTFDGDAGDIFALQASLAQKIAGALKATLTPGERTLIERRPTQNQEAYEIYLRARSMHVELGEAGEVADYERILAVYQQAIAKDPSFALAHVQVATVHALLYWFGYLDPSAARLAQMKSAVEAAVRLAPDAPETHLALGAQSYRGDRDWNRALAEFRAAEPGLPNDAQLSFWLAVTHRRLGHWSEAVRYFERAVALNPRELAAVSNHLSFLLILRRFDAARTAGARATAFFPENSLIALSNVEAAFALEGDRTAYLRALANLPPAQGEGRRAAQRSIAALMRGDPTTADRELSAAGLADVGGEFFPDVVPVPPAFARAQLAFLRGDGEAARRFADAALARYRAGAWNDRQKPWMRMMIATAEAWAGRNEEAVRDAQAAMAEISAQDPFDAVEMSLWLGVVYVATGRRDDALAWLRKQMTGPSVQSPNDFRFNPLWAHLRDDPRFEEILKSAKPL